MDSIRKLLGFCSNGAEAYESITDRDSPYEESRKECEGGEDVVGFEGHTCGLFRSYVRLWFERSYPRLKAHKNFFFFFFFKKAK